MDATLDELPGEGEVRRTTQVRVRRHCAECGEPAHYKHTFLLPNARRDPASNGYGRDDLSWCEDEAVFACRDHKRELQQLRGYELGSTFFATERFAHLFLYWKDVSK